MFLSSLVLATIMQSPKKPTQKSPSSKPAVKIETLAPGSGPAAAAGDLITVDYSGSLTNGKVFDTSIKTKTDAGHAPVAFTLGVNEVIKGWDESLIGKKSGAHLKLTIPPVLGYGAGGTSDGAIPPNATLVFDVHILSVIKKAAKPAVESKEIVQGSGPAAKDGDTLSLHYVGTFLNGVKFDSSRDRNQPMTIKLGSHQVIPGFESGLTGMKKGERKKITIPPALAYGAQPVGPIPPNSTIVFDLELLSINAPTAAPKTGG